MIKILECIKQIFSWPQVGKDFLNRAQVTNIK